MRRKELVKLASHAVEVLNRALESDPQAINWLFEYRVQCNSMLADDPTIQVRCRDGRLPSLGVLGLLNGIVGARVDEAGVIVAEVETGSNKNKILRFYVADDILDLESQSLRCSSDDVDTVVERFPKK